MTKRIAILSVLILMLSMSAAAENLYLDLGLKLVFRLSELTQDENYAQLFSSSEAILEKVSDFADTDFSEPIEARMFEMPTSETMHQLFTIFGAFSEQTFSEMSEAAQTEIYRQLPSSIVTLINGRYDINWLAASNILHVSETYILPENFHPGLMLLTYPGDFAVAVSFSQTGEDTFTAIATAVPADCLASITGNLSGLSKSIFETLFRRMELG